MWYRAECLSSAPCNRRGFVATPWRRWRRVPAAARVIISSIAFLASLGATAHADIKIGDAFPALSVSGVVNLGGGELPATAGKVVLVDFWASWCAPCKASFPALAKLHERFAERGLVIAAVSVDEKTPAALAFWKKMAPPFPTLHDGGQKLVQQVVVPAMPTTYLIGRDGRVRLVQAGFHGRATEDELSRQIEQLLAER